VLTSEGEGLSVLTSLYSILYRDGLEPFLRLSDSDEAVPWLVVEDDGGVA
jgi:hypothetical protein